MDGGDWLTAVIAVAGIIGTFSAGLLGKRIERRNAHVIWLRENRLQAYATVAAAAHLVLNEILEVVKSDDADEREDHWNLAEAAARQLGALVARVQLLGPAAVADAAANLQRQAYAALETISTEEKVAALGERHWKYLYDVVPAAKTFGETPTTFIEAARAEVERH